MGHFHNGLSLQKCFTISILIEPNFNPCFFFSRGDESDRFAIRNAGFEVFTDSGNGHMLDKDRVSWCFAYLIKMYF